MYTPWGHADGQHSVARGVWVVDTPSHGGIMIRTRTAERVLSDAARVIGELWGRDHEWLAFEEDCAYAVVVYEHPEWFRRAYLPYDLPDEQRKATALETIKRWYPMYLIDYADTTPYPRGRSYRETYAECPARLRDRGYWAGSVYPQEHEPALFLVKLYRSRGYSVRAERVGSYHAVYVHI